MVVGIIEFPEIRDYVVRPFGPDIARLVECYMYKFIVPYYFDP